MYHIELRQFPHNLCRFNLTGEELRATILDSWARDQWIELGERKWNPQQARLTVLEGPRIPVAQLSLGRGWRVAQRQGREVTANLLGTLREAIERTAGSPAAGGSAGAQAPGMPQALGADREADLIADSLGLELLAQIGAEPVPLRRAWELARSRQQGAPASASLGTAERAVASLLRAGLIVLLDSGTAEVEQVEDALREIGSWTGGPGEAWIRRA